MDQLEEYLIKSDVGVDAASEIKEIISSEKIDPKKETLNEVNLILKNYIIKLMKPLENNNFFNKSDKLKIILISGVNGVGKTTTIGKIGKILKLNENKILFSACDTFRAAAIEQLENWAKKIGVEIIKSNFLYRWSCFKPKEISYEKYKKREKEGREKVRNGGVESERTAIYRNPSCLVPSIVKLTVVICYISTKQATSVKQHCLGIPILLVQLTHSRLWSIGGDWWFRLVKHEARATHT